ncbi:MAG TPA: hypothetical protein VGD10_00650 [Allosphingosinicella sp.]|uniref:hypothetical protein n=1 Tax=Allosphingosinicella sp. TaxID=2823234 RepID=UPI002EDB344B
MPYPRAHWYILALFPLAGLAFWPQYLSQFATASAEYHAHGITASLWLLLLAAQSWTVHHDRRVLHRRLGMASLLLFPLFFAGGAGIFLGMADRFANAVSPFYTMYASRLAWLDIVGVGAFAWFYFEALRSRRKVHLHSRYMLGTLTPLIAPILGRLMPILPPLSISGPQDFWKLGIGFQLANLFVAALFFTLALRSGKHGRPFHLAAALTLLSALLYQTVGGMDWWKAFYAGLAPLPSAPFIMAAGVAGILVAYAGWIAGKRDLIPPRPEALPA